MMLSEKSNVGSSKWDGTISPGQFQEGAHAFAQKWKTVCQTHTHDLPLWSWVSSSKSSFINSHEVDGYLSLEKMCILRSDKIDGEKAGHVEEEELNCITSEDCTDPAMLYTAVLTGFQYYIFAVINQVADGQTLMLDQIERDLPPSSIELLTEAKWTFITQQEHPYLNRPWYTLHPCGTNELMKLLQSNTSASDDEVRAECYFISWLSVVSQVVGLKIPLQMAV
ncbi:Ubiquitin-like-conjugating enzyme ATG10 [Bienertia sinuspersici]